MRSIRQPDGVEQRERLDVAELGRSGVELLLHELARGRGLLVVERESLALGLGQVRGVGRHPTERVGGGVDGVEHGHLGRPGAARPVGAHDHRHLAAGPCARCATAATASSVVAPRPSA